jgi:AICAR transformylase/IMP cyclohydrolase PurH
MKNVIELKQISLFLLLLLFFLGDIFPPSFTVPLSLKSTLRYGENPHQKAAFYEDKSISLVNAGGIASAIQHHGKVNIVIFLKC